VKDIYEHYKDDEQLKQHLPTKFAKGRQIDRAIFFNVFNTLYPVEMAKIINNSRQQRFDTKDEEVKGETIEISEDWHRQLMSLPFKSSKFHLNNCQFELEMSGRTVHLLKQKTKPHQGIKHRKVVAPLLPDLKQNVDKEMQHQQKPDPIKPITKKVEPTYVGPLTK